MLRNVYYHSLAFLLLLVIPSQALSAPATLTYQGRILNSDGAPLEHHNVSFIFQITNPNGSCVVYEEQVNGYNMTNSGGIFDTAIGSGTRTFPSSGVFTVLNSLDNSSSFSCQGGGAYAPSVDDGRKLRVHFYDGLGWKTISPDNVIRSVPYAGYAASAAKFANRPITEFVLKGLIPICGAGTVLSWNGTAFICASVPAASGTMMHSQLPASCAANQTLTFVSPSTSFTCSNIGITGSQVTGDITGTAAGFTGALVGDVSGTQGATSVDKLKGVPLSMLGNGAGKVLTFNGTNWAPADLPVGNSGTVTNVTGTGPVSVATGTTTPAISISQATAATDGYLSQADWNAFNNKLNTITNAAILANGNIWIGDATSKAQQYPVSGDATLSNTGALTIGTGAVSLGKLAADSVNSSKIVDSSVNVADLNFLGVMAANTGIVVRDGNQFHNKSCTLGQILSWTANGWDCSAIVYNETDPTVGANTTNYLSKWDGAALVKSEVYESGGNVGIGTTSPSGALEVVRDVDDMTVVGVANYDVGVNVTASFMANSGAGTITMSATGPNFSSGVYPAASGIIFSDMPLSIVGNSEIKFSTSLSAIEQMRIDSSGNLGIGTTTPQAKLDVNGVIRATDICDENGTNCKDISTGWGGGGSVTSVTAGSGLVTSPAGGITGSGSLSIAAGGVGATELATNAVTTTKILDGNITGVKLEDVTGLVAGVYGSASQVPSITVDAKGRVTSVTNNAILGLMPSAAGQSDKYLRSNGTSWSSEYVRLGDIRNTLGSAVFGTAGCSANQTVSWSAISDTFACQDIGSLDASKITAGFLNINRLPSSVTNALWTESSGNVYRSSGNVGVGTTAPDSPLTISSNTTGLMAPTAVYSGTGLHISGADGEKSRVLIDAFGTSIWPVVSFRMARGTAVAPTAVQSGDRIGMINASGYDGSGWGVQPNISFIATESWTTGANGSAISFATIPNGGATGGERMRIDQSGNVGIGTVTPSSKLTVAGTIETTNGIKFPDGSVQTTAATGAGAIVANGSVSPAGACLSCRGATVARTGTGTYTVTFLSARSNANYTIILTAAVVGANARMASYTIVSASSFVVYTRDSANGASDAGFSFMILSE